jgi:hypothetical protein
MTIVGTSHFVNFTKACDYYKSQGLIDGTTSEIEDFVRRKLEDSEIFLGKPELDVGDKLVLIDNGYRYGLVMEDKK